VSVAASRRAVPLPRATVAFWRKRDTSPLPDETLRNSRWGTDATRRWWTGADTSAVLVVVGRCLFAWCVFVLAAAALASPSSKADAATTTKLRRDGISTTLPKGWHGRIYRRAGGLPIVQAGNFQQPASDDDVGTKAIKRMRADSIFFVLLESERTNAAFPYPRLWVVRIRRSDFLPSFEGVPAAHAFARRTFATNGRKFQLWLQFGRRTVSTALRSANTVIEQLRVAQRR
jgi:hypothetical protein